MKRALCLSGLFVAVGFIVSASQEQKPIRHEVSVSLKLIQVYVAGKDGKPAMNLGKTDFRIYDNGQEQAITEFEKHTSSAAKPMPPSPENATILPTPLPEARLNRKFFIFIDQDANDLEGIAKARTAALHFLDTQVLPTDEIGVFSYSTMKGVVLHTYLTADHAVVREALKRVRDAPGRTQATGGADTAGMVISSANGTVIIAAPRAGLSSFQMFTDRMTDLAKALRYVSGYKNIIYFSQGLVFRTTDADALRQLDAMTREFTAANAPFFAVNTETPNPFRPDGSGGKDMLALLARKTGGKAFDDVGAVDHFPDIARDVQEMTRNYYVIGYPIKESWDGKYHKIKVELASAEYKIQAQAGYNNPKPYSDYSDLEKELHLFDLALSEKPRSQAPLIFPMAAASFHPPDAETGRVLLMARLPASVIEKFGGRSIELVTLVLDEQDHAVDRIRLKLKPADYAGKNAVFAADSAVPPGSYRCRIILRDLETGESAMAYARAVVPAPTIAGLRLETPLLLATGGPAVYIDGVTKRNSTWKSYYGFDPSAYALAPSEVPPKLSKLTILIPCKTPATTKVDLVIQASLIDTITGVSRPLPIAEISRRTNAGAAMILAELSLEGIRAGTYRLYLHAEEATTKSAAYSQIPLVIR